MMYSRDFPLSCDAKQAILKGVFDCNYEIQDFQSDSTLGESYFEYYRKVVEECNVHTATDTHQNIVDLVGLLKQPDATRNSVNTALKKQLSDEELNDSDEIILDSINLAMRLLLMMPTGVFTAAGRPIAVAGGTKLNWGNGCIIELASDELSPQDKMKENVKLEKIFNARNLERIAGIEIRWTCNFADHLRMRDDDKAVEIFHYASFLKFHRNCRIPLSSWQINTLRTQSRPVLSEAVIDETLRTLALLFPEHDKKVETWFKSQQRKQKHSKLPLDPLARECGQLKVEERQIDNFQYWHDRIVILKQVFDEAEPSNIRQWWNDRRKRVQWYTFWVAAVVLFLTVFFGLVQSVEGGVQVYYAAKSSN